jgi:hypothetical protein
VIESDEIGQSKLEDLFRWVQSDDYTEWEKNFIADIKYKGLKYRTLSSKQKSLISNLWERM